MTDAYNTWTDGKQISTARLQDIVDHMGAINNVGFKSEQASDYIVFKSGTNYYVRNGSDGTIESAGTSTSSETALEWANTQLADKGGTITVKGLINLDAQFDMNVHGVTLQGTSRWLGRANLAAGAPLAGLYLDANVDDDMIYITGSGCTVRDLFIYGNKANNAAGAGVRLGDTATLRARLENLHIHQAKTVGAYLDGGCTCHNVWVEDCGTNGFEVRADCCGLIGCSAKDNDTDGFVFDGNSQMTRMIGCYSVGNAQDGLSIASGSYYTVVDNSVFYDNGYHGLYSNTSGTNITNCQFLQNSQDTTNTYSHIYLDNSANYSTIIGNNFTCPSGTKVKYHVEENTGSDNNTIKDNVLASAPSTDYVLLYGVNDDLSSFTAPFIDGTAYDDKGWDIDAAGEYATTFFSLPQGLKKVVWLHIWAMSVDTETHAMHLEVQIEAATDNEGVTTHTISKADLNSTSTNFAANDLVHWSIPPADTTVLGARDSIMLKVLHEVAGGDDCETDARFRSVEVSYV